MGNGAFFPNKVQIGTNKYCFVQISSPFSCKSNLLNPLIIISHADCTEYAESFIFQHYNYHNRTNKSAELHQLHGAPCGE